MCKLFSSRCQDYICDARRLKSELVDSRCWLGVPETLQLMCHIIEGLNTPVKSEYQRLLRNVLVPMHNTQHLGEYHKMLQRCCPS